LEAFSMVLLNKMRKLITIFLILLIIISIGVIAYYILNQNNISLRSFTDIFRSTNQIDPQANTNPFPVAPLITQNTQDSTKIDDNNTDPDTQTNPAIHPTLGQINIAGLFNINLGKGITTTLVDRSNGNIYTLDDQNNSSRLSYTTLPSVLKTYLGKSNGINYILIQQLKELDMVNTLGQFKVSSSSEPLGLDLKTLSFAPLAISVSPDNQKIAYLTNEGGEGVLYVSDWSFLKPEKLWTSSLTSWNISYPNNNLINITTRPAYDYLGISYLLNLKTKQINMLLNNINGLIVSISPEGDKLIYSKSLLGNFNLYSYNIKTKESRLLEINTLPDKCTWLDNDVLYCATPKTIISGRYPDEWYQGKTSFSDNVWRIDLKENTTLLTHQLKGNYDLINLTVNEEAGWLYAIDKNSGTLQTFNLKP